MKHLSTIFSAIALVAGIASLVLVLTVGNGKKKSVESATCAAPEGSIVYFNLDRVLEEYDMANDLRSVVETKAQSISQEISRKQTKLEKDIKTFQDKINKGLLVSSVAQAQQEKLQKDQEAFQNYYAQKQQEMAEEQSVMMNQIADAINSFIEVFNAQMGYSMILTTQGDILPAPVVTSDPSLDITDAILDGLNAEYVKNKGNKKEE